jgi:hypothetical protein
MDCGGCCMVLDGQCRRGVTPHGSQLQPRVLMVQGSSSETTEALLRKLPECSVHKQTTRIHYAPRVATQDEAERE